MGERKYVQLMFLVGGMLLAYILVQSTDWVWGYFEKPERLKVNTVGIVVAFIATYLVWRHRPTQQSAAETVAELRMPTESVRNLILGLATLLFEFALPPTESCYESQHCWLNKLNRWIGRDTCELAL